MDLVLGFKEECVNKKLNRLGSAHAGRAAALRGAEYRALHAVARLRAEPTGV